MKTTTRLLLSAIMAAFCCSIGNAQLIYSNLFTGVSSQTNSINGNLPSFASGLLGGSNSAPWVCTFSNSAIAFSNNSGTVLVNGNIGTNQGCALLPFKPVTGHVYDMNASITLPASMVDTLGMGFTTSINYQTNNEGFVRFNDSPPNGYGWLYLKTAAAANFYGGAKTALSVAGADLTPVAGTYTFDVILSTLGTKWTAASYVNGVQIGSTNVVYSANPAILSAGIGQATFGAATLPIGVQWNNWSLSGTLRPFVGPQPISQSLAQGSVYTNGVGVTADPNGGTLSYQWYTNGVPIVNGGAISGATTSLLTINPVSTNNAFSNYYVTVMNNAGVATSSVVSLSVFVTPTIAAAFPIPNTNPITLFGGTNVTGTNYFGSTPTFSVLASGSPPLAYQWLTNGVVVGGATKSSFTLTNCQLSGPTNFTCVVTNGSGKVTNAWSAVYIPTPFAPYPQAVLAAQPVDFWRLNESAGVLCDDYQDGNDGIYTNVTLAQGGYNANETAETSVQFSPSSADNSYAGQIQNVDFAATNGANAEFTVEAWAYSYGGSGSPVVIEGTYGTSEEFDLGTDTNATPNYQFYVRTANGTVYTADSSIPSGDVTWHHLVGVCDEANTNLSLYIDGLLAVSTSIPANSGLYEPSAPMSIGGQFKSSAPYPQFNGYLDDVAAYRYALTASMVATQYIAYIGTLAPAFEQTPPASVTVNAGATLVIPAILLGSSAMSYTWTDLNTSTTLATGSTNGYLLDATLTIPNVSSNLNGDPLQLAVNSGTGPASATVTLTVNYGAPVVVTDVIPTFGAPLGGTASDSVTVTGSEPFYYQWQFTNGVNLVDNGRITGSQSSTLNIANAQLSDQGSYQVIITNIFGAATSSVAMFVVDNDEPLGFNDNGPGWTVNNVANISSLAITNGLLTLTDGHESQARTFFFDYPVYIGAFQASFTYQDVGGGGADGWAFVVQNDPRGASAGGGDGGRVGVESGGGDSGTSIEPSWEVEFNIYTPAGVGYDMETEGAVGPPWLPTGNLGDPNYAAETNMMPSGHPINVTLNYANGVMSMVLTDAVANASFSTNVNIGSLPGIVGGETAYVGFAAGDGGVSSVQTITNFTFVSFTQVGLQLSGTNALVFWPSSIIGYTLQQNPGLSTTNWVTVTNVPAITNAMNQIIVPAAGGSNLFYRLMLP